MGNTSSTPSSRSLITETPLLQPVHQGFNPTRQDVQIAVQTLMGLRLRPMPGHLPSELALSILAHADYRPRITSSRAELLDYHCWGHRPWYLTTQMLPPDFRRASSVTLQVRSEDQMDWGHFGANSPDGTYDHSHTWFKMCILRPLRKATAKSAPPVCGGARQQQQALEVRRSQIFRSRGGGDRELEQFDQWLMVNHNGRDTWVIHHNNKMLRDLKNYRIDWSAVIPTDIEDPRAVGDGEGFLSALMPGDKIALWAAAEDPAWGITVVEAVIEIVYDVWI